MRYSGGQSHQHLRATRPCLRVVMERVCRSRQAPTASPRTHWRIRRLRHLRSAASLPDCPWLRSSSSKRIRSRKHLLRQESPARHRHNFGAQHTSAACTILIPLLETLREPQPVYPVHERGDLSASVFALPLAGSAMKLRGQKRSLICGTPRLLSNSMTTIAKSISGRLRQQRFLDTPLLES